MWIRGKEYYSVNKWVGILNRDYAEMGINSGMPGAVRYGFQELRD